MHIICTICTELITQDELGSMYVTRCGHIFHLQCMMQWINRSPCCPQCREHVTKKLMTRVYPTLSDELCYNSKHVDMLVSKQQQLKEQIVEKDAKLTAMSIDLENSKKALDRCKKELNRIKIQMLAKDYLFDLEKEEAIRLQSNERKMVKKVTAVKERYRYLSKRNIEWRKSAMKKHAKDYRSYVNGDHRKRRSESTSSSQSMTDSLSHTDSSVSTDSESETSSMST